MLLKLALKKKLKMPVKVKVDVALAPIDCPSPKANSERTFYSIYRGTLFRIESELLSSLLPSDEANGSTSSTFIYISCFSHWLFDIITGFENFTRMFIDFFSTEANSQVNS